MLCLQHLRSVVPNDQQSEVQIVFTTAASLVGVEENVFMDELVRTFDVVRWYCSFGGVGWLAPQPFLNATILFPQL